VKRFRVLVGAKNIVLATPEGQRTGGFFATRFVDALDGDAAKRKAVELILNDSRLTSVADVVKVRAALTVEELEQVSWFRRRIVPAVGFTFVLSD